MPPLLTWLDHAGFLLEHGDVRLATDPWGVGDAFLHGWRRQSREPFPMAELARATHVWFSHEHADHFSPATLRALPAEARARMRVLYQATRDGTLRDYCRSLGFAGVIELPHLAWHELVPTSASAAGTRSAAIRGCSWSPGARAS